MKSKAVELYEAVFGILAALLGLLGAVITSALWVRILLSILSVPLLYSSGRSLVALLAGPQEGDEE